MSPIHLPQNDINQIKNTIKLPILLYLLLVKLIIKKNSNNTLITYKRQNTHVVSSKIEYIISFQQSSIAFRVDHRIDSHLYYLPIYLHHRPVNTCNGTEYQLTKLYNLYFPCSICDIVCFETILYAEVKIKTYVSIIAQYVLSPP